jgi:hypothetical protein
VTQDERYVTSYKEEFGVPNTRKTQFVTTAENLLNNMRRTEQAINRKNEEEYE